MRVLRWLRARQPSTALVVALLLGPSVAMFFLNRWRTGLGYFALENLGVFAGFALAALIPGNQGPLALSVLTLVVLRGVGAVHSRRAARAYVGPPRWFARWPALIVLFLVVPNVVTQAIRMFAYRPFIVEAASMEPTLYAG